MPATTVTKVRIDQFDFKGLQGCDSHCSLHVERLADDRTLVIFTELESNPGTSVTKAIEILASLVASKLALNPAQTVWIEHYPPRKIHGKTDDWDLVMFGTILHDGINSVFDDPFWRPLRSQDWASLGFEPSSLII
jgi:hypothetical protein